MKVLFSPPDITESEIAEVVDALRSGWITTGPKVKELERQVAAYCGTNRAVCLNSQTACAELVLRLLEIGEGDEVLVPAYTYTATASVVCHVGATPVMIDCQPDSLEMDYEQAAAAINERTKAIIPVDLAGIPCDYQKINEIVISKRDLFRPKGRFQTAIGRVAVCADTAHSFGAQRGGAMTGTMADFSSFSFHAVKNFTTAEGGALTWNPIEGIDDEEIYRQLQLFSLHGQSKDALAKTKLGAWEYDIVGTWYKCNLTDVAAAIGLAQMKRYDGLLARRKEIIEHYDAAFRAAGFETLKHYTDHYQSSGHLYIVRVPGIGVEQRNEIIIKMAEAGIACNVHYKPLPMMTAYRKMGLSIADYPNAFAHYENAVSLPLHTKLTNEEVEYVCETFVRIASAYCQTAE